MQVTRDGQKIRGSELLAVLLWEIATTGKAKFPDGTELIVSPRDWLETVKWLYSHIDGPAPKALPEEEESEELTDEDLAEMSDEDLKAFIKSSARRKGRGK